MSRTLRQKLCVGLLFITLLAGYFAATAHPAQAITNSQIDEQRISVKLQLVETLREHVKLLQMHLIKRLENEVAYLQSRIDAQSK